MGVAGGAAGGGDAVELSLQQYLLCKLQGHPVLDAAPLGNGDSCDLAAGALGFRGLVVWADPQRLLLLLEEAGGTKKTLTNNFAAFRYRCRSFFQYRSGSGFIRVYWGLLGFIRVY